MEPSSAAADLVAGFVSGAVSTLAVHPVDTILTRFQAAAVPHPSASAAVEARSMASALGVLSLWRGAPFLIGAAPFQNALLMAGYGAGRRWNSLGDPSEEERITSVFLGGVVGGLAQCLVASPAELWKVRKQVQDMLRPKGNISAGLGATMLRDGLPHGIWFASYEWCKHKLGGDDTSNAEGMSMKVPLLSGAFAAFSAWAVGYPFDLIKTRIQAGTSSGVASSVRDIVGKDGWSAPAQGMQRLYRGFGLKLARSIPASAIGFAVYEYTLPVIEKGLLG